MADAYFAFWREYAHEGPAPAAMSFPDPVWEIQDIGLYTVRFKRSETKAAYRKFHKKFFREPWTSKWSRGFINRTKTTGLSVVSKDSTFDEVRGAMQGIADELDKIAPKYRVIFTVNGVTVNSSINFGDDRRLFVMDDAEFEGLAESFKRILETMLIPDEQKPEALAKQLGYVQQLKGWTCCEVIVEGDDDKAKEDAASIAEPLLDFAQLVAISKSFTEVNVAGGVVPAPRPPMVLMSVDGSHGACSFSFSHAHRFELSQPIVEEFRQNGFAALLDAIAKPRSSYSDYEILLVDAMHWIANAERQSDPENRVTSYITALEMFFTASNAPITRDVSEGVAYILERTPKERAKLRDRIVSLYGRRSEVSHRGQRDVAETEVHQLRVIGINFLARMSHFAWQFKDAASVRGWLATTRLSGSYQEEPDT
ncbi:MAG TPA: hypothetical protein VGF86_14065 [Candidatus Tumulicola sp.]|jgi:hypothetical protein